MGLVDYFSRELCVKCYQYNQIPNIIQYDDQFLVAKLDLMKRAWKCFLLNESTFERKTPQLQSSYHSPHAIELLTTQIAPQKEGSIHAEANYSKKTNSKRLK